jgi:hypothetical protein
VSILLGAVHYYLKRMKEADTFLQMDSITQSKMINEEWRRDSIRQKLIEECEEKNK